LCTLFTDENTTLETTTHTADNGMTLTNTAGNYLILFANVFVVDYSEKSYIK